MVGKARSAVLVTVDLLAAARDAGRDGVRISHLTRRANLSAARTRHLVGCLTGAGLVVRKVVDGGGAVAITPNGLDFLGRAEEFVGLADSIGLEI